MHDRTLPYYDLYLISDLDVIPMYDLPKEYEFQLYNDNKEDWIDIEVDAGEIKDKMTGSDKFNEYYNNKEEELSQRMIFLTKDNVPIGTITAYYRKDPFDDSLQGDIHWMAIKKEHRGKGLAKPLISHAMKIMKDMGYSKAFVHTQTHTWLACKIYLDMGFKPINLNKDEEEFKKAWELVNNRIMRGQLFLNLTIC